jgi:hypothetical protein
VNKTTRHSYAIALPTAVVMLFLISYLGPMKQISARPVAPPPPQPNMTVFFSGLFNPRGLKFGPDGNLYVAEGGIGGSNSTVGLCEQVKFPVGPYLGSPTGSRISKIDHNGIRTTVADNLPSSQTGVPLGSLVSGVSDVAFIGSTLYGLLAGAGCSHGVPTIPNGVIRVNSNGTSTLVADLSAFQKSHPVANPELDDFEPDGTEYSMVAVRGDLYVVEPNHGEVDRVSPDTGAISRVVDVSASQGHIVPTTIAYKGNFFFGNLGTFPIVPGGQRIMKLTPSGNLQTVATGLTTVLGLAFDDRDRMYALQSMTQPGLPGPGEFNTGNVVMIEPNGRQTVIASGLNFPSAMTFGPDGALYVSNVGFGAPPIGLGQIVRIEIPK